MIPSGRSAETMDDLFLLVVPTLVMFAAAIAFVTSLYYEHKEYRLDEEVEKQKRKQGDG